MKSPWLWGIVALALALRVALAMSATEQSICTPDSADYKSLMVQLVGQQQFNNTFRTPGYPLFLAPLMFGWKCVLGVQIALDCGLVVLTFLIGRKLISHQAGLLGAFLQAVSPLAIASSCRILSDSLYAFMLGIVILLLVRNLKGCRGLRSEAKQPRIATGGVVASSLRDSANHGTPIITVDESVELSGGTWKALLLSAVVLGAATYVRPIGMMMAAPIALVLLCGRRGLARAGAFALIYAMCLSPWVARNIHTQNYYGFSRFASDSFCNYVAQPVMQDVLKSAGPSEYYLICDKMKTKTTLTKEALKHPLLVAKYQLKGAPVYWLPDTTDVLEIAGMIEGNRGTLGVLINEGLAAAIKRYFNSRMIDEAISLAAITLMLYLIWMVGLVIFVAGGLRRTIKSRLKMPAEAWIILLLVLLSMLAPGPASHPRFRVPLEPYLCIASAAGWLGFLRVLAARKN